MFSHASKVALCMARNAFGAKNGVVSLADMRRRLAVYRREKDLVDPRQDPRLAGIDAVTMLRMPASYDLAQAREHAQGIKIAPLAKAE